MRWKYSLLGLIVLAILAAFPWGPLFAWSPVHPGYRQLQFSRADVLYPDSTALDPAYREVALRIVGIPGDRFVDHGSVSDLRRVLRLDAAGLAGQARDTLAALKATPTRSEVRAG